jgi:hypothetical protein
MRITAGLVLATFIGFTLGCGGKPDAPAPENKTEPTTTGTNQPVDPNAKAVIPAAVPAVWEMDPAKHVLPTTPVSGKVRGDAVTLEVQAEKQSLTFLLNKNGQATPLLELHLSDQDKSTDGLSLTVKPDQAAGLDVPNVIVHNTANPGEVPAILRDKYALTLKLGKREKGKLSGSINLSLPDEKKTFIAGTFTADWIRALNEVPGPDDAPFIQGKLTFAGAKDPDVWLGYVRLDPYDPTKSPASDVIGTVLKTGAGEVRSPALRPLLLMVPGANPGTDPARFEVTRLEPGHYWLFATVKGGPAAWKFVTVEANSQLTVDLSVDTANFGSLAVTAPGTTEFVAVVPVGEAGKPWPETLVSSAASISDLYVNTAANKPDPAKPLTLNFPRLAPGKYEVWSGDSKVDVEIKAKDTAKVELKKK